MQSILLKKCGVQHASSKKIFSGFVTTNKLKTHKTAMDKRLKAMKQTHVAKENTSPDKSTSKSSISKVFKKQLQSLAFTEDRKL